MEFNPTYAAYRNLLSIVLSTGKLADYSEADRLTEFIILRHDIEFSVERAMTMSLIESEMGIQSTYFVQIRSNAYNTFSLKNTAMLRDMCARGHRIGLHFHIGASMDPRIVTEEISAQCRLLQEMLQVPIDRYSMHRPLAETKYYETDIPGLINAYGPDFFTFAEILDDKTPLKVKYISDAKHHWNYGTPDSFTLRNMPKVQLLIHPDFWSEGTPGMKENFAGLIREHGLDYTDTIDHECHHFTEFRDFYDSALKKAF